MASVCRSAAIISRKSVCTRPNSLIQTLIPKPTIASAFSSSTTRSPLCSSRFASVLVSLVTMLPLHSTIAAARLKSNIAMDTSYWSLLSQDFAVPR
ncbi:hypothetical protein ABFS83_02G023000 [Erythranthe nasuta]|uniref:Uncharacterized protein n=1 Tax=Erythranthe guttata TaxID=4155 RepID=A0A022RBT3_ERYGU|nr:PREDICTED: uncharacterized protein LOC105957437 [Erythranthe guttata]EYU37797.1 hypothetical protein MIMGU_mgv1a017060mg [Erythranthe guttata]|eukprot:XP_012836812.1 PREDICTED: uncharacterized protein LOC105957437 [Erythranthe guttata]